MNLNRIFFIGLLLSLAGIIIYANVGIKEMDNFKVWNNAYLDLSQKNSYTVQEDIELKYTLNNKEYSSGKRNIVNLINSPFLQKNVKFLIEDQIAGAPEQTYYIEDEQSLFYIQNINGYQVKNELDPYALNNHSETPYTFFLNHMPINMTNSEENKFSYTYKFKLNQYLAKYHGIFDESLAELPMEFKTNPDFKLIDQEIIMKINFTEKYQFINVSFDLTNVFKSLIEGNQSSITNYSLIYLYSFSNYNNVKIDENEYKDAILDNAPNELDERFIYPTLSTKTKNEGKFEYGKDVDVYYFSLKKDASYQFKVETKANINFKIVDSEHKPISRLSNDGQSYTYYLESGQFYIIVENKDSKAEDYQIEIINLNSQLETVLK